VQRNWSAWLSVLPSASEGLLWRRLTWDFTMLPRFVSGEHSPTDQAFAEAHWVRPEIAVGKDSDE
jgi:hypothetical protein